MFIIIIIVVAFVHLFLKLYHLNFPLYRLYCLHSNAEVFLKRVYELLQVMAKCDMLSALQLFLWGVFTLMYHKYKCLNCLTF